MRRAFALLFLLSGCALTSKSPPLEIRYFSPEAMPAPASAARAASKPLRLGRIGSSAILRYRIVHRESPVEVETYETLRWTDDPEVYVRRSLSHALFDGGACAASLDGAAPALDVDVVAFEEVRAAGEHHGRVVLRYELHDDHAVLAAGTIAAERPARGDEIGAVVVAIGAAMNEATARLASVVEDRLAPPP